MENMFDLARRIRIGTIQAMVDADILSFSDGLELLTEPLTPGDESTRFNDSEHLACPKCHQKIDGQTGEYPCAICGMPTLHDTKD
jgi:Zn finger protein HypA/HybF involved in hydrogenase expression